MRGNFKNKFTTEKITRIGILSALAGILMYIEFPLPFMPPFLKLDIGDLPALVGSFALGPVSGIIIELIKNLIHLPVSSSLGAGEVANFIVGAFFVGTSGYIYKYKMTKKGAIIGMTIGTAAMVIISSLSNYFFLIPFYAELFHMPLNDIVSITTNLNPLVKDMKTMIVFAFIPFNLFKGLLISIVTALLYKYVSPLLHKKRLD